MGTNTPLHELPGFKEVDVAPFTSCVGIKPVDSSPLTLGEYNRLMGNNEDYTLTTPGYMVKYSDNYLSWSPASEFENHYKSNGEFSYEMALYLLKTQSHAGAVIYRKGWNGANQHIVLIDQFTLEQGIQRNYGDPSNADNNPTCPECLFIKTTQNKLYPWSASPGDIHENDWCVKYL